MTTAQKTFIEIQKKQSTLRGEFNTLRGVETRSAEQDGRLTALDGELTESETEFRQAADDLLTEQTTTAAPNGGEDTEAREKRELCERASVADVYNSILEKRGSIDGATAEAQAAHGCAPNQIPIQMIAAPVEVRAVTPTPGASQTEQAETVQPVFATGAGNFLAIDRPSVAMGQVYQVLTSRPNVGGPITGSTDAPDTTGAFDADLLPPKRIQASFIYRRTDAMQFSGMDSSLRQALNSGLQEKLDLDLIAGTDGLLTGTNLPDHDVSAVTSFANYLSRFLYGRVDGRFAEMKSDIRVLMGAPIYAHAGSVYQSSAYKSALSVLEHDSGGVRVSAHVPDVASKKQDSVIRLGTRRDAVQPIWSAVTIVVDEVTLSGKGEIEVTALLGMNTKILRQDGFHKQQSQIP